MRHLAPSESGNSFFFRLKNTYLLESVWIYVLRMVLDSLFIAWKIYFEFVKGYAENKNISDVEEVVSEEKDNASVAIFSSSNEEINTKHKLPDIMKSNGGKQYGKHSHVRVLGDYKAVIFWTPGPNSYSTR